MPDLSIDHAGGITTLTLDRAERHNAFDETLIAALTAALDDSGADPACRAVVLAARGPSFCAGADLDWMRRMAGRDAGANRADARALAALMQSLDTCPKPTIALVQGAAHGGGVGLVACCDLAVATPEARFCLSEVRLGLIPAVIAPYVARAIGTRAARRYALTAESFDSGRALALGLIDEVAPAARLTEWRDRWLGLIARNGPRAMAEVKTLMAALAGRRFDDTLAELTADRIARVRAGDEGREGVRAFLEKRPPTWIGG